MIKYTSELLHQIEDSLDIKRYSKELPIDYLSRVAYSLAARWMLASLFDDTQALNDPSECPGAVSIHHIKRRFKDIFSTFFSPKYSQFSQEDITQIVDQVYDYYLACGYFYHLDLYVTRPRVRAEQGQSIQFHRGMSPEKQVKMCGLGPFSNTDNTHEGNWKEMFGFELDKLIPTYEYQIENAKWTNYLGNFSDLEYLNLNRRYGRYWVDCADKDFISLARTKLEPHHYFLCKVDRLNGMETLFTSPLTLDLSNGLWVDFANAIFLKKDNKIVHRISEDTHYYEIKLQYLLPKQIQIWFDVYSWPVNLKQINPFNRLIRKDVFNVVKPYLEQYGIVFEER